MKVILTENVKGLGQIGDIKTVRNGYGRNFLLPKKMAILATEENLKKVEELNKKRAEAAKQELEQMKQIVEKLNGLKVEVKAKTDEKGHLYASVKSENIAAALKEEGIEVDPDFIEIPGEIKKLGEHRVLFKYNDGIQAEFKIEVVKEI